jgi:hypothetical protein
MTFSAAIRDICIRRSRLFPFSSDNEQECKGGRDWRGGRGSREGGWGEGGGRKGGGAVERAGGEGGVRARGGEGGSLHLLTISGYSHRVHTEWQWPLSGVHTTIMRIKSAQPGVVGGCTPSPFHSIYHHEQSCGVRSS